MRNHSLILGKNLWHVFLLTFLLIVCTQTSFAAPTENIQPAALGWVHLEGTVPEGFTGTVSASFTNTETGEVYSLTAHRSSKYKNSIEVPIGQYSITSVYTSEDRFIYEALTDLEEIQVNTNAGQTITVKVLHNKAAEEFLASPEGAVPAPIESEKETAVSEGAQERNEDTETSAESSDNLAGDDSSVPEESISKTPANDTSDTNDRAEEPSTLRSILLNIVSLLGSALLFSSIVVLGCWLYARYKENNL